MESLGLIDEYGRIPIGDKIKISKMLQCKQEDMKCEAERKEEARKLMGLEAFSEVETQMIMQFAPGTTQLEIEYGIELWDKAKRMFDEVSAVSVLKRGTQSLDEVSFSRKVLSPEQKLLHSFGYRTFDYTRGRQVTHTTPHGRRASADPLTIDIMFGNVEENNSIEENNELYTTMYSLSERKLRFVKRFL